MASKLKFVAPALAGALLTLVLVYWRGFFWYHATVVGVSGAALVYWSFRAMENLRRL